MVGAQRNCSSHTSWNCALRANATRPGWPFIAKFGPHYAAAARGSAVSGAGSLFRFAPGGSILNQVT